MAREFEGRGWRFPISLDDAGAIAEAREEDKVRQSIEIILRTAPG
jgi:phage baseplate assembly protein W